MQSTISAIATAHTRYASGAAAPSDPATLAGSRKMPPPIVMLMMPAASPNVPMTRTSDSLRGKAMGSERDVMAHSLASPQHHHSGWRCYRVECMRTIWDISPPIAPGTPVFPGDTPYSQQWTARIGPNCPVNVSAIAMSAHLGVHADAPLHYSADDK